MIIITSCDLLLEHDIILDETYAGKKGLVAGWGTLKEDGKPSCILQEVEVPIITNEECVKNTSYTSEMILDTMLCAG